MARLAYPEKHTKIVCLPKYFLNVDRNKNVVKVNMKIGLDLSYAMF